MSFDSSAENKAFSDKFGFRFPLLSDTERTIGLAYGACDDAAADHARRVGVIIDPEGKVVLYQPSVNPDDFPAEALSLVS